MVAHHALELWHVVLVKREEVDMLLVRHLEADVWLSVGDEAANFQPVILFPLPERVTFVEDFPVEQDGSAAAGNHDITLEDDHLAEIAPNPALVAVPRNILRTDGDRLALPIEHKYLLRKLVIENVPNGQISVENALRKVLHGVKDALDLLVL